MFLIWKTNLKKERKKKEKKEKRAELEKTKTTGLKSQVQAGNKSR